MRDFLPDFPVSVLVQQATGDPDTGRYRVQGVMSIERRAVVSSRASL